jgi:hypothetical protein
MTGVSSLEQYNLEEQEKMTERYPYDISSFNIRTRGGLAQLSSGDLTSRNGLTLD